MESSAEHSRKLATLESKPWDPARIAAAVVSQAQGNLHVGILYRHNALHLAWEHRLRYDWKFEASLWVCPSEHEESLRNVAQWCRTIQKRFEKDRKFPYGLGIDASFDEQGHILVHSSSGFTCASLIMAVFRVSGIELLNVEHWPVRSEDDQMWLEGLRRRHPTLDFTRLQTDVDAGRIRIRPEEVMGACIDPPVEYEQAVRLSQRVLRELDDLDRRRIEASLDATFDEG